MNQTSATRIAMWSGPRNISTAMMRSFGNRPDCFVTDEPLYAHYLQQTGMDHPGRSETLEHHEKDWKKVAAWLIGDIPEGRTVWYQKQMAHHLLPNIDRGWLAQVRNCFLVRDPREMLTSLVEFIPSPRVEDTGLLQQLEIFNLVMQQDGIIPLVIDSRDVLENPSGMLRALCERIEIPYTDAMMSWPAGKRETDGAWADHWYAKVYQTTSFGGYQPKNDVLPESLSGVYQQCLDIYERLAEFRIVVRR